MAQNETQKNDPSQEKIVIDRMELMRAEKEQRLVDFFASKAAVLSDKKIQAMLSNPRMRDRILAIARVEEGGAVRWMPEKAREYLKIAHAEIRAQESEEQAKRMNFEIEAFVNSFQSFAESLNQAEKLVGDGPALADLKTARDTLALVDSDSKKLAEKEKKLRDQFQKIIEATAKAKTNGDFIAAIPTDIKKIENIDAVLKSLDGKENLKLETITKLREALVVSFQFGLSEAQIKTLEGIRAQTDATIKDLDAQRERLIGQALQDGNKFRRMLGGAETNELIAGALEPNNILNLKKVAELYKAKRSPKEDRKVEVIVEELKKVTGFVQEKQKIDAESRAKLLIHLNKHIISPLEVIAASMDSDKTINLEKLQMRLLNLGEKVEMFELQSCLGPKEDPKAAKLDDPGEKKLVELLRGKGIDNPAGISLKFLLLRANFPEPVVNEIDKAKYDPPMWVLGNISKLKNLEGQLNRELVSKLLVIASKESEGKLYIKEEDFIDLFTFVFLRKGKAVALSAEDVAAAKTEAGEYWKKLRGLHVFVDGTEGMLLLDLKKLVKSEFESNIQDAAKSTKGKTNKDFLDALPKELKNRLGIEPLLKKLKPGEQFDPVSADAVKSVLKKEITVLNGFESNIQDATKNTKGKTNQDFLNALPQELKNLDGVKSLLNLKPGEKFDPAFAEVVKSVLKKEKDVLNGFEGALAKAPSKTNQEFLDALPEELKNMERLKPLLNLKRGEKFDPASAEALMNELKKIKDEQYGTKGVGEKATEFYKAFDAAHVGEIPWDEMLKSQLKEGVNVAATGAVAWWKYIKEMPKIVYDPEIDGALKVLNDQDKGHRMYRNVLQQAINRTTHAKDTMDKLLQQIEASEMSMIKELKPLPANANPLDQLQRAKELLYVSQQITDILEKKFALSTLPIEVQDRALWLAMNEGMPAATAYLQDANKDFSKYINNEEYKKFEKSMKNAEVNSGRDVLVELHHVGVHVLPQANDLLASLNHGEENVMLAVSSARVGNWMLEPAKARPALTAVLIVSPGLKGPEKVAAEAKRQAIIDAFCTQSDVPGATYAEALKLVKDVQTHLQYQSADYQRTMAQNEKKERFGNPLDILKSGTKELKKMLRSNNKVEKALAITMIVAAGYFLWQTWKKKGFGQKLILGIPLFFGADILVKRMTGKGVLDRMGMRYMNEQDRGSSVEQFIRRNNKDKNYKILDTDPGRAAIQALMSPEKPIPVDCLITWRKNIGAAPEYRTTAPENLKGAAQDVIAKMGSYTKANTSPEAIEEEAYRFLYTAFDALCANVASDNADVDSTMTEPKAQRGAELIERRYVKFNEDFMIASGFSDELKASADSRGGYTMLDVLVFERQTPAMQEALYGNDYFLEWMYRGTGIPLAFVRQKLNEGLVHAQIYAEWGKEKGKILIGDGIDLASDKAKDIYEWLQVTYPKAKYELREDWLTVYQGIAGTLSSAGVYLQRYGDDAVEWTIDFSVAVGKFTIDTAQNIHRELLKIGLTGEAIEWFDDVCISLFGHTMSEYILYKDAIEDTPAKRDAHIELLASDEKLFGDLTKKPPVKGELEKQFESIAPTLKAPWIILRYAEAKKEVLDGREPNNAFEKLAVYELLKRRMYSYMIARRIEAVQALYDRKVEGEEMKPIEFKFPNTLAELTKGKLEQEIERTYGLNTLAFLGSEKTNLFGSYQEWVSTLEPGYVRSGFEFLNWTLRAVPHRDNSTEYLTAINEYHAQFMKEAEEAFQDLPEAQRNEKLLAYENYLQTVLANAVVDATLRGQEANGTTLPTDKIKFAAEENTPLTLAIARAKNFLQFLRVSRGASVDPKRLDINFKAFETKGEDPKVLQDIISKPDLMYVIQQAKPKIPTKMDWTLGIDLLAATKATPNTLSPAEVSTINNALAKDPTKLDPTTNLPLEPLTSAEEKAMADSIGSDNFNASDQMNVRSKLEQNAQNILKEAADFSKPEEVEKFLLYIKSLPEGQTLKAMERKLFEYLKKPENLDTGLRIAETRDAETRPEQRQRLQTLLNKGIAYHLDRIVDKMEDIAIADLPKHPEYKLWLEQLVKLYIFSNETPDYVSDTVSEALEYALYQGKWNSKGGFAKYKEDLTTMARQYYPKRPVELPEADYYKGKGAITSESGAKTRMSRPDMPITAGYLWNVRDAGSYTPVVGWSRLDYLEREAGGLDLSAEK